MSNDRNAIIVNRDSEDDDLFTVAVQRNGLIRVASAAAYWRETDHGDIYENLTPTETRDLRDALDAALTQTPPAYELHVCNGEGEIIESVECESIGDLAQAFKAHGWRSAVESLVVEIGVPCPDGGDGLYGLTDPETAELSRILNEADG